MSHGFEGEVGLDLFLAVRVAIDKLDAEVGNQFSQRASAIVHHIAESNDALIARQHCIFVYCDTIAVFVFTAGNGGVLVPLLTAHLNFGELIDINLADGFLCVFSSGEVQAAQCLRKRVDFFFSAALSIDHVFCMRAKCVSKTHQISSFGQVFRLGRAAGLRHSQHFDVAGDVEFGLFLAFAFDGLGIRAHRQDGFQQSRVGTDVLVHPLAELPPQFDQLVPGAAGQRFSGCEQRFSRPGKNGAVGTREGVHLAWDEASGTGFDRTCLAVFCRDFRQQLFHRDAEVVSRVLRHDVGLAD